jgi:hypothetical protein
MERTILALPTRRFTMITNQALPITFGTSFRPLLTTVFIALRRRIGASRDTAKDTPAGAELAPCHRYDIGEIDCRPPSPSPSAMEGTQQTLEGIWLRYF